MAMPAQPTEWTVEMVRALPDDGNRYEVIDGELFVTPAPSVFHQRAVVELLYLVGPYVKAHGIGEALIAPADVVVYGPRKFVQPDLFVVPLVDGTLMRAWTDVGRLILAVEVISPSTTVTITMPGWVWNGVAAPGSKSCTSCTTSHGSVMGCTSVLNW